MHAFFYDARTGRCLFFGKTTDKSGGSVQVKFFLRDFFLAGNLSRDGPCITLTVRKMK